MFDPDEIGTVLELWNGKAVFSIQWEQSVCWTFGAVSEQLVKEGRIPGALYAGVDKLDGHIWKQTDLERLQGEG